MTFLPVVERELREAVRRPATRWLRLAFALVGALVAGGGMLLLPVTGNTGGGVFRTLIFLLFGYCGLIGVFQTADCLSEKREGTLGLLFLTDLRGYDVVLGKLAGRAAGAAYGWLAVLPMVAVAVFMGGVTEGEFWRQALLLILLLFLSLSVGLAVSAVQLQALRTAWLTFLLLLTVTLVPLLAHGAVVANGWRTGSWPIYVSPWWTSQAAFDVSYRADPSQYWMGVLSLLVLGLTALVFACLFLPRSWRQGEGADDRTVRRSWIRRWGTARGRLVSVGATPSRVGLVQGNPVTWLVERTTFRSWRTLWWVLGTLLVLALGMFYVVGFSPEFMQLFSVLGSLIGLVLRVVVIFEASRFFIEARRTNALELLVSTPLSGWEIVEGQVVALRRKLFLPALLGVGLHLLPVPWVLVLGGQAGLHGFGLGLGVASASYNALLLVADLYAAGWLTLLLALACRNPSRAPLLALLYLVVLPFVAFCVPRILIDLPIIFAARDRLRREFMELVRRPYGGRAKRGRSAGLPPPLPV